MKSVWKVGRCFKLNFLAPCSRWSGRVVPHRLWQLDEWLRKWINGLIIFMFFLQSFNFFITTRRLIPPSHVLFNVKQASPWSPQCLSHRFSPCGGGGDYVQLLCDARAFTNEWLTHWQCVHLCSTFQLWIYEHHNLLRLQQVSRSTDDHQLHRYRLQLVTVICSLDELNNLLVRMALVQDESPEHNSHRHQL